MTQPPTTDRSASTTDRTRVSRRRALASLASAGALGTAGCLGGVPGLGTSGEGTDVDGLVGVTKTDRGLSVSITDTAIETVTLVDPSGSAITQQSVATGATETTFQLLARRGSGYQPGTYTVVGATDEETIAETTVDLEPSIEIVDVFSGEDRPDLDWENRDLGYENRIGIEVENTGTGPDYIDGVRVESPPPRAFSGDSIGFGVDTFVSPDETEFVQQSGPTDGQAVFASAQPRCDTEAPATIEMVVRVLPRVAGNTTWSRAYRYTEVGSVGDCDYEPVEREDE